MSALAREGIEYILIETRYIRNGVVGIFIRRPEAEAKIRELAERTGETITDAIERAVEERLARLAPEGKRGRIDWPRLEAVLASVDALPRVNEDLTADEIIGYDEYGVPR